MTIQDALKWGIAQLRAARVETPELDGEVLLLHGLSPSPFSPPIEGGEITPIPSPHVGEGRVRGRAWLYAHSEQHISRTAVQHFKKLVRRRTRREPVAYIVGHKEFYGLDFLVNNDVLVPRPETEVLVEQAIEEMENGEWRMENVCIVDVGTGSGAIAVAVAKEFGVAHESARRRELSLATPKVQFFATDISSAALQVAKQNARRHGVADRIKFLKGNLLEPLFVKAELWREKSSALIVANLPYLPTAEWRTTMPEVKKFEPRGALDGGKDGLKYYRELFEQLHRWLHNSPQPSLNLREGDRSEPPLRLRGGQGALRTTVLCEICPEQIGSFRKMVRKYFPKAKFEVIKDLAGRNRVVIAKL